MMIYVGSDHAGFELKETLREHMKVQGHNVVDVGTFSDANKVDYPDIAKEVATKVQENAGSRGVLICGTGIGISIAANKVRGIRAANVHDATEARLSRQHNDANIVALGQRTTGSETAKDIVDIFLSTDFEGGRHTARVEKITALENGQ
jgi:ribose 5-phosphate isomerase B